MTVAELIAELAKLDSNSLVMIPGYEGGFDIVTHCDIESVHYFPEDYCGDYQLIVHNENVSADSIIKAVVIQKY